MYMYMYICLSTCVIQYIFVNMLCVLGDELSGSLEERSSPPTVVAQDSTEEKQDNIVTEVQPQQTTRTITISPVVEEIDGNNN